MLYFQKSSTVGWKKVQYPTLPLFDVSKNKTGIWHLHSLKTLLSNSSENLNYISHKMAVAKFNVYGLSLSALKLLHNQL